MKHIFFQILLCLPVVLGAQNIPHANFEGPLGAQVNTYNGNLFLERTDLFIPNQGLALTISFSYNALRDTIDHGFGLGWSFNYDMQYYLEADTVIIEQADGRTDRYTLSGNTYLPPNGIFDELTSPSAGTFVLETKYGMSYFFEDPTHQKLTKITDANGNSITLEYTNSELTTLRDASNRSLQLSWNDGHLSSIVDRKGPEERTLTYTYNGAGYLLSISNPVGGQRHYTYNDQGCMASLSNENGDLLSIFYYTNSAVASMISCFTKVELKYNEEQNKTYVIQSGEDANQVTTFDYDEEGRLLRKSGNCCGYEMSYSYDNANNLNSRTDANGNTSTASHDALGNTLLTKDALGNKQTYTYEPNYNRISSLTDKRNFTSSYSYDGDGNITQISQPLGIQTNLSYDAIGNVTSITDANNQTTSFTYNSNNDVSSISNPIGTESYQYDNIGNLLSITDPNNLVTNFEYDKKDRLTQVEDPLGHEIQFVYDGNSNLTLERDANGNEKRFSYDAHDRLTEVSTPTGSINYGYDAFDNLSSISDGNNQTTIFQYDNRNRVIAETDPLGNTITYSYDSHGNVSSRTDANGLTTNYTYDGLNRMISYQFGNTIAYFEYDGNNNLIHCSNNTISLSFTFDALNRMTSKTINNWGKTITYTYDNNGNRTAMTDPDNGTTSYQYDANNRLIQLTNPFNQITTFEYDLAGRMTQMTHGNGTYSIHTYDNGDRLTNLTHYSSSNIVLASYSYTYDNNGNRLSASDENGNLNTYSYDADNRLTGVIYDSGISESFSYDPAGNRVSLGLNGQSTNYAYNTANRLTQQGNTAYSYDANGNLLSQSSPSESTTYAYDGLDRLTQINLSNGETISFNYDPLGNRISRTQAGITTYFFYDGINLLAELDTNFGTTARYTSAFDYDSWLSLSANGNQYFYHKDGINSTRLLTDSNGNVVASYTYEAYGNISFQTGSVYNPFTFTGRYREAAADIYYYRTRYYDGKVGRFLTQDKFRGFQGYPLSNHKYLYGEANPINNVDPTGEWVFLLPAGWAVVKTALAGAALGAGIETLTQYAFYGNDFLECFDGFSIGLAAVGGVAGVGSWYTLFNISKLRRLKDITKLRERDYIKATKKLRKTRVPSEVDRFLHNLNLEQYSKAAYEYSLAKWQTALGGAIDLLAIAGYTGAALGYTTNSNCSPDITKGWQDFKEFFNGLITTIKVFVLRAIDPNEIVGPPGVGAEKWVAGDQTLPYTIFYENDPEFATGPAQRVTIFHEFSEPINPFSFRVGDFGFGDFYFEVPEEVSYYTNQLDLSDSLNVILEVAAGLDVDNNRAFWIFESKDPATGLTSSLAADQGYLPVNDTITRAGEGFVNFTVAPSAEAITFDRIEAGAAIIFDDNPPLITNVEFNTIDEDAPVTQVGTVDTLSGGYRLHFLGSDVGSGLASYTLHVSTNGGPFLPLLANITSQTIDYPRHPDSTYQFFSIGVDSVGNVEALKSEAEGNCMAINVLQVTAATEGMADGSINVEVIGNSGEVTYTWSHDDMLSSSTAENLPPGTYQVIAIDEQGCTVSRTIEVGLITSAREPIATPLGIQQLFPIPAREVLNIRFFAQAQKVDVLILSTNGKRLKRVTIEVIPNQINDHALSLGGLPAGTYLLQLRAGLENVNATFIKQ